MSPGRPVIITWLVLNATFMFILRNVCFKSHVIMIYSNKEQYFRYENKCQKVMEHKMVEEKRPICKVEIMANDQTKCKNSKAEKCKKVMKCSLAMKMMKNISKKHK